MQRIPKIILTILLFLVLSYFIISSILKPSEDYYNSKSVKSFNSTEEFEKVHLEYIGQIIDLKGIITNVNHVSPFVNISLDKSFLFSFDITKVKSDFYVNQEITLKARYTGIDNLFEEYSFTDCFVK